MARQGDVGSGMALLHEQVRFTQLYSVSVVHAADVSLGLPAP